MKKKKTIIILIIVIAIALIGIGLYLIFGKKKTPAGPTISANDSIIKVFPLPISPDKRIVFCDNNPINIFINASF